MKLSYFDLLSPDPIQICNVGSIISPTLREIRAIGYNTYQYYLSMLLLDENTYMSVVTNRENENSLSDINTSPKLDIFELLTLTEESVSILQKVLNFFMKEEVFYLSENHVFAVKHNDKVIGAITKDNYSQICDLICQRNNIKSEKEEDLSKVKSKKALDILNKLKKGRKNKSKQSKNKNMELENIISAVANKSPSLNILNIWDLTVYQLWDSFSRLCNNNIYDIQSMSVAAWGDKDNHFDATSWFKRIENE